MPRRPSTPRIVIHELHFSGFELPMEHEKSILESASVKEIRIHPVEYHIIKTYNQRKGKVEYKAVIPLPKRHYLTKNIEKVKKLFEDTETDYEVFNSGNDLYLILTVPEHSELIDFIKVVEEKVSDFEKISADDVFHVGVAKDEIYIDKTSNAPITVKRSYIPGDSGFVIFVLNNFEMPKFWFKVYENVVILGDFNSLSLRFLHVAREREHVESNRIIVSYSVPSPGDPLGEFIRLRIEDDIEKLKEYDRVYRDFTRLWVERAVNKYTPELKTEIMDVIDRVLEKKALKVITAKEYSTKFFVEVITPDGRLYSEDFIPAFVLRKIVKTYYDSLLFQLLRIYLNEARELMANAPDLTGMPEDEKKGFLGKLLRGLKKPEKNTSGVRLPEDENELFIDIAKDYAEED